MTVWNRVRGDVGDTIVPILDGVTDLTGVTAVVAHVWTGTEPKVDLTAAVLSSTDRTITVQLGTWLQNTARAATYKVEYEVSFGASITRTWPEGPPDEIRVRAQGG